jgi:hypothetical protein
MQQHLFYGEGGVMEGVEVVLVDRKDVVVGKEGVIVDRKVLW